MKAQTVNDFLNQQIERPTTEAFELCLELLRNRDENVKVLKETIAGQKSLIEFLVRSGSNRREDSVCS